MGRGGGLKPRKFGGKRRRVETPEVWWEEEEEGRNPGGLVVEVGGGVETPEVWWLKWEEGWGTPNPWFGVWSAERDVCWFEVEEGG